MRALRGIVVAAALLVLITGCSNPKPGAGAAPHGDAAPQAGAITLTDAEINTWQAAINGYRAKSQPESSAFEACYLLTRAQVEADLAHPNGPWTVDIGPGVLVHNGQPANTACLVRAPDQAFGLGTANGDVGGQFEIEPGRQAPARLAANAYRQVPIPGTSWSLVYMAWHQRMPSANEMAWVLRDLTVNWSQSPPAQAPSAYFPR